MPTWDKNLTDLKDTLTNLIPFREDVIEVVRDAGFPLGNLRLDGRGSTIWSEVLDEALKRNKVLEVIRAALKKYPGNQELITAEKIELERNRSAASAAQSDDDDQLDSEQIRKQIDLKTRRKNKLEEKAAVYGLNTPPEVEIEIEDLKEEIKKLKKQLG